MDWNRVEGNWKQVKGKVKEQWGKLTDDDLDRIAGKRDQLEGKIQERYGIEKDRVRRDVDDSCPVGADGKRQHSYDYREGGCRQVKDVEVSANLGWANPATASSMVMRRG